METSRTFQVSAGTSSMQNAAHGQGAAVLRRGCEGVCVVASTAARACTAVRAKLEHREYDRCERYTFSMRPCARVLADTAAEPERVAVHGAQERAEPKRRQRRGNECSE